MASILIVEDDEFIREVAEIVIADMGHLPLSASDLDEALVILRSSEPIDALLTDIRLKGSLLGGYELARQAIILRPQLRVLYASGASPTDKTKALFVKAARSIEKPYTQPQLESAIRDLLASPDPQTRSTPSQ